MRRRKMWQSSIIVLCLLCGYCNAGPVGTKRNMPIMRQDQPLINEADGSTELDNEKSTHEIPVPSTLTLPSNATSIRADIMDGFKCDDRPYGYYADVENDCQIFHVCLPVTYADGKENTFRWSFICPEETIFSQDSFTCMRPEDMNIDCSESQNYYDLNRNFGMTEGDTNKEDVHSNLEPVPNKVHEEALSVFSDKKAQSDRIVVSSSNPEPTIVKPDKPKRVYKPINGKPLHNVKNKPTNTLPLRKMPQISTVSEPIIAVSSQNSLDTQNQKRRRPVHKVSVDSSKQDVVPETVVPTKMDKVSALKSDHTKGPEIISTSNLGKLELPNTIAETAETTNFVKIPELTPVSVEEADLVDDKENEKNEETDTLATSGDNAEKTPEELPTVHEPIETAQSDSKENVASEVLDEKPSDESANSEKMNSPAIFEENSEEDNFLPTVHVVNEALKTANTAALENNEEETHTKETSSTTIEKGNDKPLYVLNQNEKLETVENIPALEPEIVKESPQVEEEVIVNEETSYVDQVNEEVPVQEEFKLNTDQDQSKEKNTSVEDVESENAAAILTTQTDDNSLKQTMGGFKPVDAEKAAEAEAIITDFLNTLRSTETTDVKPIGQQTNENNEKDDMKDDVTDKTEKQETPLSTDDTKETEIQAEQSKHENIDESEDKHELVESEDKNEFAAPSIVEEVSQSSEDEAPHNLNLLEELKNIVGGVESNVNAQPLRTGPIATYPIMNSFPSDMYQIPVKVIEAPTDVIDQSEPILQTANEEIAKEPLIEVAPNAAIYTPLSIEDIVDLVKERLDQTPMEEKNKPMHLTVEALQTTNQAEENNKEELSPTNSESLSNVAGNSAPATQESEEIIMPIYHRLGEIDSSSSIVSSTSDSDDENSNSVSQQKETEVSESESSSTQTELSPAKTATVTDIKSTENVETENKEDNSNNTEGDNSDANLTKTKTSRLYRSRSIKNAVKMDPRKRRFLFRRDSTK